MIEWLQGTYLQRTPHGLVVNVNGVGYSVEIADKTASELREGDQLELWIHTQVKEDSFKLFGFRQYRDKLFFANLLTVSGVGPKVALGLLSQVGTSGILSAVEFEQVESLVVVPGVGHKLAKRLVLEMRSKLKAIKNQMLLSDAPVKTESGTPSSELVADLRSALLNLGYKSKEVETTVMRVCRDQGSAGFPELFKVALGELARKPVGAATIATDLF